MISSRSLEIQDPGESVTKDDVVEVPRGVLNKAGLEFPCILFTQYRGVRVFVMKLSETGALATA